MRLGKTPVMPVGLDGNPEPIVSAQRNRMLAEIAAHITRIDAPRVMIGVDGRSGVGKSTFADELAGVLQAQGSSTLRSTTDLFHRPRHERMRRGPTSPDGYYLDSHQLTVITDGLLVPFREGASSVTASAFDEPSDTTRTLVANVGERAVLIFDGLFVHRPELRPFWNLTITLVADRRCDAAWLDYLEANLPADPTERAEEIDRRLQRARWPRYREGWRRYVDSLPPDGVDLVIDNEDFSNPSILARAPESST